jgi:hypothetical protein
MEIAALTATNRTDTIPSDYYEEMLQEHKKTNGSELGFHLTSSECQSLREEAVMYYHRYLSLFILGDYPGVVRDTARQLRVLDICSQHAAEEHDRLILEQYRPYIIMMKGAKASILFNQKKQAPESSRKARRDRKEFFAVDQADAFARSNEVGS